METHNTAQALKPYRPTRRMIQVLTLLIIALVFMVIMQSIWHDFDPTGLFSSQYSGADWSWGKFVDMLKHVWVPIFLLGVAGTADPGNRVAIIKR